jgi:hypothetical protein
MNKTMILLIISSLMFIISCKQEQPTQLSPKYDKNNIQNDTNWVEIFDIDTVKVCIRNEVYYAGKIAASEFQYKEYFDGNLKYIKAVDSIKYPCFFNYIRPNIDFGKRDILLYFLHTGGGFPIYKRHLYKNSQAKLYLYLLEVNKIKTTEENSFFDETIAIPKIEDGFNIKFDTLQTLI